MDQFLTAVSLFHEPPPLDSEIPPPLDDKDNDFDLEEEIIEDNLTNNSLELPELPTDLDFNVFSSAPVESISCSNPSSEHTVIPSSPHPVKIDKSNSDVAKEKESFNTVVLQDSLEEVACNDTFLEEISSVAIKNTELVDVSQMINVVITSNEKSSWQEVLRKKSLVQENESADDFDEFVSCADENQLKSEPLKCLEISELAEFTASDVIPELKANDDEDDFNDFEEAIPINRQVREQIETFSNEENKKAVMPEPIQFEADFGAFNETTNDITFEDFQEFKASAVPNSPEEIVDFVKPTSVNNVLDMMFVHNTDKSPEKSVSDDTTVLEVINSDIFVNKIKDFDSTLALGYLYSNSKTSQTLLKALSIDTRNILLGPQWASAASNMPRFAANMSFNPIEPLKSKTPLSLQESVKPSELQPVKVTSEVVPEAEFDWNSSGLVNPLDGSQPKPQQPHEPVHVQQPPSSSTHSLENESSLYVVDQEISQIFETETKANASHKPELNLTTVAPYLWSNDVQQQHLVGTSNILIRERTIKLPETHIFTPVKGTSPIAREVVSRDVSPAPEDPYFVAKGSIVVKEYHDVEYSLEPKKRSDADIDFDEFQSATVIVKPDLSSSLPLKPLEPLKAEKSTTEIKWPDPGSNVQLENEFNFLSSPVNATHSKTTLNPPLLPPPVVSSSNSNKKEHSELETSPTKQNGDQDDFTDFQEATSIKPTLRAVQLNDPITLSPARLVAQQSNQKSTWISSMDDDEISRIEAAFPKCKSDKKPLPRLNDDDDWSDFVAAQPTALLYTQSQPPSMISSNTMGRLSYGDGDDWSEFVSVPPKVSLANSTGAISSQLQSKPNFSAWSQPVGKHQFVNHSTSFLTNEPRSQTQEFTSNNYPYVTDKSSRESITITDNFNYNFNHHGSLGSHSQQQQIKKPNRISTILPELHFAIPKHLLNLPRTGGGTENFDNGKK